MPATELRGFPDDFLAARHGDKEDLVGAYRALIGQLESALWEQGAPDQSLLAAYQGAFREMERLIAANGDDRRHRFVIVIPVADRPQHLEDCLHSLVRLCESYAYGGFAGDRYSKVSVVIADDSRDENNIRRNREIAAECRERGIETEYFGLVEQLEKVDSLTAAERNDLKRVIGAVDRSAFYHKGPSIMRNLAYLKLDQMSRGGEKMLFYFIDSDQEFQVKVATPAGEANLYAINYLYELDRIFSTTEATILTGKVVGDPPVSPAVMAGNFLLDVVGFLQRMADTAPSAPCEFHAPLGYRSDDASYHDMAALFGFQAAPTAHRYPCPLSGEHDNGACFAHFAQELGRFFYGEHPTRKTYYGYEELIGGVRPARTIYTGNYIFRPQALKYFIPFSTLRLRMAGPVLGRLIKAEIGERFVSANLPMLHKRTVRSSGQSEFRPGIQADGAEIDLSGEFERQFYGDVMLFSIEKLVASGFPQRTPSRRAIVAALATTHRAVKAQYEDKRLATGERLAALNALLGDGNKWWNHSPVYGEAMRRFRAFAANIGHNFGDGARGYELVACNRSRRHAEMLAAISGLALDRQAWTEMLARTGNGTCRAA